MCVCVCANLMKAQLEDIMVHISVSKKLSVSLLKLCNKGDLSEGSYEARMRFSIILKRDKLLQCLFHLQRLTYHAVFSAGLERAHEHFITVN